MPSAPMRTCSKPGCGSLVAGAARCKQHQHHNAAREGTSTERGYGSEHQRLRLACLRRDDYRCRMCGWQPRLVEVLRGAGIEYGHEQIEAELRDLYRSGARHLVADHVIDIADDASKRLDLGNLQTLCSACHSRKSLAKARDGGVGWRRG